MQYDVQNLITNLFALSDIPCVQELLQALVCNGLGGNCSIGETTINEAIDYLADHQKSLIDNNTCMPDKARGKTTSRPPKRNIQKRNQNRFSRT